MAINIEVIRMKLREFLVSNKELARRFDQVEHRSHCVSASQGWSAGLDRQMLAPGPPCWKRDSMAPRTPRQETNGEAAANAYGRRGLRTRFADTRHEDGSSSRHSR